MTAARAVRWRDWSGTQRASAYGAVTARSAEEVAAVLTSSAGRRVRPVGAGHSFSPIARPEPDSVLLRLDAGAERIDVDDDGLATVPAALPMRGLNAGLWARGWCLSVLGDVDTPTLAGALATSTHGTGARSQGIAASVRAFTLVTAGGEVLHCDEKSNADIFRLGRVHLGALGVLVDVTVQCEPAYGLTARCGPRPLEAMLEELEELNRRHDHVEFFWWPHTARVLSKILDRVPAGQTARGIARRWFEDYALDNGAFGALCRLSARVPAATPRINRFLTACLSESRYTDAAPAVFCSPRLVRFTEMEYAVPAAAVHEAMAAVRRIAGRHAAGVTLPVEVRFAAADDIALSTGHGRDTAYVAVHVRPGTDRGAYFTEFEAAMGSLGGRPHWGKVHSRSADQLGAMYPLLPDFASLRRRLDPQGRFSNGYLDRVLPPLDGDRGAVSA